MSVSVRNYNPLGKMTIAHLIKKFPRLIRNPKINCYGPPLDHILSQMNSLHTLTPHLMLISVLTFHLCLDLPRCH